MLYKHDNELIDRLAANDIILFNNLLGVRGVKISQCSLVTILF